MRNKLFLAATAALALAACGNKADSSVSETISFDELRISSFSQMENFPSGKFIVPQIEDARNGFISPEQVLYDNGKLYVEGLRSKRIVIYDDNGRFLGALDKKGNSAEEYLQITSFDVDRDGDIWVFDGQKDKLIHYSPDGDFVKTFKLPCEVDKIKCLDDGKFLMSVAAWDTSAHKDKEVLLVDENMEVLKSFIDYEESVDPNFTFSSQGFTETPDGILYHRPISDYVYLFSDKGRLLEKIHVDFGGKSVPDYVRKDVENNYDELSSYRMIVNAIHVDDEKVVGCVLEKGKYTDFIIDMTGRTVFLRDKEHDSMHLVGISGGYAIFYVPAGQDASVGYMPDDVKTLYDKDNDVFFLMDLSRP